MTFIKHPIKQHLLILLSSVFIAACSVEQKPKPEEDIVILPEPEKPKDEAIPENIILEDKVPEIIPEKEHAHEGMQVMPQRNMQKPLSNQELFSETLATHNRVRAKHGLSPLKWSDKLAAYSQQWADHLGQGSRCTMRHRGGTPPYGENLYWSSAVVWSDGVRELNRVTIRDVVKAWADEEAWYNYQRNTCLPGKRCGHYTQIVWKNTTEVGCAVKVCADKSQTWVCSYNPPGNFTGQRPY